MVRSRKQSQEVFPFSSKQKNNSSDFKSDNIDKLLSGFALAFFGMILLLISFDTTSNYNSSIPQQIKNSAVAKIAAIEKKPPKERKVSFNKAFTKKSIETPKAILVSKKSNALYDTSPKVETINTPVSYSTLPAYKINTAPSIPYVKHAAKKVIPKVTRKAISTKVNPKSSVKLNRAKSNEKLTINSKITDDLLPASFFNAKQLANQQRKPMLIKFGAKWCLPCRQMEKSTLKNPQVLDFMKSNYVTLFIDVDDFDGYNLKSYYNITTLPTFLVFNAQGNFLAKYSNSISTSKFMSVLVEHHQPQVVQPIVVAKNENFPAAVLTKTPKLAKTPMMTVAKVTNIIAKKKNGQPLKTLKGKAKNWRSTSLEVTTTNLNDGQIIVNLRNLTTGEILNESSIPLKKLYTRATTTTSIHQLDISHEKKKDKSGEYVVEIYHATPNQVRLIGKTSFLKDGQFIWKK